MSNKHTLAQREIAESIRLAEEAKHVERKSKHKTQSFTVGQGSISVGNRLDPEVLSRIETLKAEFFGK